MNTASKFRKKPVVIEAWDFDGSTECAHAICDWIRKETGREDQARFSLKGLEVRTLESSDGWHVVSPKDFVIKGVKGEFYPCKPDIFTATYDEVVD